MVSLKIYAALEIRHGNSRSSNIALQSAVINLWKMNGIKNYKNHKIIDVNSIKFFSLHFPKICYVFSKDRTAIKAALALFCFRCIKKPLRFKNVNVRMLLGSQYEKVQYC